VNTRVHVFVNEQARRGKWMISMHIERAREKRERGERGDGGGEASEPDGKFYFPRFRLREKIRARK